MAFITLSNANNIQQRFFFFRQARHIMDQVFFRASAFTGAKLVSGVPAVIGRFGP